MSGIGTGDTGGGGGRGGDRAPTLEVISAPTLEVITPEECFRLLAAQSVGRVAVAEPDAAPLVVPVNFVVDGESVVFRTDEGSKFDLAVLAGRPVSFEVDGLDGGRRCGWSVLLQGTAAEVAEPRDDVDVPGRDVPERDVPERDVPERELAALRPWAPGSKGHWVRIVARAISGRRIRPAPDWRWTDLS
ncbi:MAG: uncharacterized protein QOJ69_2220 [Actinomycetota bacterium]|jgi:nitroimidazol reductase NimA-like FMN-containing flavoprotein (pyridoxamine 5'-phosphate oxidase superfamily)|nr:uncharacterized protein [Actinomycetota bacterium]